VGKILLAVALFAVMVYGIFWLLERRRGRNKAGRTNSRPRTPQKRTLGPDDDEEFLRQLEQRRRRAAREEAARDTKKDDPEESDPDGTGHRSSPE